MNPRGVGLHVAQTINTFWCESENFMEVKKIFKIVSKLAVILNPLTV